MVTLISHSPEDTIQIGASWGQSARAGWLIGLCGDLGSGKTQLVKGLARGLGISVRVHSPSFTLVNQYEGGRLPLDHLDLYRLNQPEDVHQAGLEEFLWEPGGVTMVEWIDRYLGNKPWAAGIVPSPASGYRYVTIQILDSNSREIRYEDFGP
jgi:tRNA threonylcarbamoyladenosine biosynthesis protein TsaE